MSLPGSGWESSGRLRRRVVGADVAVAVVLVGVGEQHAGREREVAAVGLAAAVGVEAGAVAHLEQVGVLGRRALGRRTT